MPTNLFDDEPLQAAPTSPPAAPRSPRQRRGSFTPIAVVAVVAAVVALVGGGFLVLRGEQAPAAPAASSYLVSAPKPGRAKGMCVDASGSSGDGGVLARTVLQTTRGVVAAWPQVTSVPQDRAVAAQPGLNLTVRMVEVDSFSTAASAKHTVLVKVPAVPGLSAAAPVVSEDDYVTRSDQYATDYQKTAGLLAASHRAAQSGAAGIGHFEGQKSNGSDVTGCVLALAAVQGPNSDLLVVSDLQDTRFTAPDGAQLAGSMSGIRLQVIQSCPSGIPTTCEAQRREFLTRLQHLGLASKAVTTVRPERAAETVHSWLGR